MADHHEPLQLRRTKLYRPRTTGDLIARSRIYAILDHHRDGPATLVCAPAGFGKTSLLSDWLASSSYPSAWLALDKGDSDLSVFLSYFLAAVRTVFPSACTETLTLVHAPVLPPLAPLAHALANDLDRLTEDPLLASGQRFILVLDDYHLIQGQAVHALLAELLRYPPRSLHLILSVRQDPPIPLHVLRAAGELGEIRMQHLRFTPEEIDAFMRQALGAGLSPEKLAVLTERTEGWATGLRLAALGMRAGSDLVDTMTELPVDDRYVLDYLLNEVLSHVPFATQDFLLKTSILERLSGPLCDVVTGTTGAVWSGHAYLEWLNAQNLFTFALDAQGTWYRYHHLFQRLLRNQLEQRYTPQDIATLHSRASTWLAQNGLIEEAITHAVAAGDEMAVVQLVEGHRHEAMNHEHWRQLQYWLTLIPRRLIDARAGLLTLEGWILLKQWHATNLSAHLARIDTLMAQAPVPEPDRVRLDAEIDALRSWTSYYVLDVQRTSACAEHVLANAPLECSFVRSNAWFFYGAARQMTGDIQGALDAFQEGLKEDRVHGNGFPTRLYVGLCFLHWVSADVPSLMFVAATLLQLARERDLAEALGWAHYFRGCAFYLWNQLAAAEDEFVAVMHQRYFAHDLVFSQSAFGLASVYHARGADQQARELVDSVRTYALETNNSHIMADAGAMLAWLALHGGAVAEAIGWTAAYEAKRLLVPMTTFHLALVTRARILVHVATAANREEAALLLDELHGLAHTGHNAMVMIEVLALEAVLQDERGSRGAALATLEQAVALGEPGSVIRVFADLGSMLGGLLHQLLARGATPVYVRRILTAIEEAPQLRLPPPQPAPTLAGRSPSRSDETALIEPLSNRELEVLALLNERLSNKEIARALSISPATVKRHTINIYEKLQVSSRRAAVAEGVRLGLLPPPQPNQWSFTPVQ